MYRVMLIDDEESARNLLRMSIDWEGLELCFAGEAASGIEAINIIDDIRPDIVFVDISMPFMNGIEFTKLATDRYPELCIIVLTGFDDFDYARQCVSLPVIEYMLKPIVRKELNEVLKRAVGKLDKNRRSPEISSDEENFGDGQITMNHVADYIKENYKNSALNLTFVAQHFGFNPSYLSRRFKQEQNLSFVEYLMKCRMDRAACLAKKNIKMYCAANEVGIPDPNYFGRCFKKYTGVSYSDYK